MKELNSDNIFTWDLMMPYVIVISLFGIFIYSIIDVARSNFEGNEKSKWFILILLLPFFGPLLYIVMGSRKKIAK